MLNLSIGSGKALLRRAQLRKELVDPTRYRGGEASRHNNRTKALRQECLCYIQGATKGLLS